MKEQLMRRMEQAIASWDKKDIYALSLFVYDDEENPCKPTVTLGYNTERQFQNSIPEADDEREARWNYAFWLQNEAFCFGIGDTAGNVRQWIQENGFPFYEDEELLSGDDDLLDARYAQAEEITKAFVGVLVELVQELHTSGILTRKFGREIPVLIHELEYYDEIAEQNIQANGMELVEDFVEFCRF